MLTSSPSMRRSTISPKWTRARAESYNCASLPGSPWSRFLRYWKLLRLRCNGIGRLPVHGFIGRSPGIPLYEYGALGADQADLGGSAPDSAWAAASLSGLGLRTRQ